MATRRLKGVNMHKSYQPILPSTNKLLKKKWDEAYYTEHRRLVKTAKPVVDTTTPRQHPHVISKQKKEQLQKERAEVIDRDNMMLMKKMESITHRKPGGPGLDHINQYHGKHHSLNLEQRGREFKRVARENEATLKRIQQVQPHYKSSRWIDEWREKQKFTELITCYPQSPTKTTSSLSHHGSNKDVNKEQLKVDETSDGDNTTAAGDLWSEQKDDQKMDTNTEE